MSTHLVLLDWDGTVVDTREALLASWHRSTKEVIGRQFPADPDEHAWTLRARGAEIFAELTGSVAEAAELAAAFDRAYGAQTATPFMGIPEALALIARQGSSVGLVTSKARVRVELDMATSGIGSPFDVVVTGDDVAKAKPDPEGVRQAASRLGVEMADVVLIGDTSADLEAGRAAGARVIHAAWGYGDADELAPLADCTCHNPYDLPATLQELWAHTGSTERT